MAQRAGANREFLHEGTGVAKLQFPSKVPTDQREGITSLGDHPGDYNGLACDSGSKPFESKAQSPGLLILYLFLSKESLLMSQGVMTLYTSLSLNE